MASSARSMLSYDSDSVIDTAIQFAIYGLRLALQFGNKKDGSRNSDLLTTMRTGGFVWSFTMNGRAFKSCAGVKSGEKEVI